MESNPLHPTRLFALLLVLSLGGCGGAAQESGGSDATADHAEEDHAVQADEHADAEAGGVVTLTEPGMRTAGIQVAAAEERAASGLAMSGVVPGQVEFDPARVTLISPRVAGRIERLAAVEGDRVLAGQLVVEILSTGFLTAQQDFLQALRRMRLLEGSADAEGAAALADAARQRLRLIGAADSLIDAIAADDRPRDLLPINAPFGGRITAAHVLTGASVEPGSPIFTLADLSVVNVAANVPERSLRHVRVGQPVAVTLAAFPERSWQGTVARVKDELDRETRTATALIQVANDDGSMRAGMFASIRLGSVATDQSGQGVLAVPASAVVADGDRRYVFTEIGERSYERRDVEVTLLAGDEGWVAVDSGLVAGDRVVIRGAFTLKAELAKGAFGEHHH